MPKESAERQKKRLRVRRELRQALGDDPVCRDLVHAIQYLRTRNQELALLNTIYQIRLAQETQIRSQLIQQENSETEDHNELHEATPGVTRDEDDQPSERGSGEGDQG